MRIKYEGVSIEEILTTEEIDLYHTQWREWDSKNDRKVDRKDAQCYLDSQVLIGDLFFFTKEEAPSLKRNDPQEIIICRAKVFQEDLRRIVPHNYQFGKIKRYLYPFWNEYHLWQVMEQLSHASRNIWVRKNGEKNYGLIITTDSQFKIRNPLFFRREISTELIWHKKKKIKRKGQEISFEDGHFSFYDKDNEVLARAYAPAYTREREWIILSDMILGGDLEAREKLCQKLLIQRKYLDKIGRKPPYKTKELLEEIKSGMINKDKLEKFFSMWDL